MWRSTLALSIWLFATYFLTSLSLRVTPPGNVWRSTDYAALLVLVFGAYYAARFYRGRWLYCLYGCVGACAFLPVLLPDGRDYISIGMGKESMESYLIWTCLFVVVMGIVCRVAATLRHLREEAVLRTSSPRCEKCGYLLYGLTEKRCPECATRFSHEIPSAPR
jgi:hypothetical protein